MFTQPEIPSCHWPVTESVHALITCWLKISTDTPLATEPTTLSLLTFIPSGREVGLERMLTFAFTVAVSELPVRCQLFKSTGVAGTGEYATGAGVGVGMMGIGVGAGACTAAGSAGLATGAGSATP